MGIIATDDNQITFIFESSTKLGRECMAYAESAGTKILTIDINKTKISDTQWAEIAERVDKKIPELIATDHPAFTNTYGTDVDLDENDALKVLHKHPEAFVYPIAIRGNKAVLAHSFSDILKLVKPDSSGINIP